MSNDMGDKYSSKIKVFLILGIKAAVAITAVSWFTQLTSWNVRTQPMTAGTCSEIFLTPPTHYASNLGVELKYQIPENQGRDLINRVKDLSSVVQTKNMYFLDTGSWRFSKEVIFRVKEIIQHTKDNHGNILPKIVGYRLTVKFRSDNYDPFKPKKWRKMINSFFQHSEKDKYEKVVFERDVFGDSEVFSLAVNHKIKTNSPHKLFKKFGEFMGGKGHKLQDFLSSDQKSFLKRLHIPLNDARFSSIQIAPPVETTIYRMPLDIYNSKKNRLDEIELTIEEWRFPNQQVIYEVSTKVAPELELPAGIAVKDLLSHNFGFTLVDSQIQKTKTEIYRDAIGNL